MILPFSSRAATRSMANQRYCPSARRTRSSVCHGSTVAKASRHIFSPAAIFSGVFLFERLEPAATFLLFDPRVIPVAPVGRRQVRQPYAARSQVFAIVVHHAKKLVVGLKNAPVEIPDENSDDVGIDQAP